MIGDEFGTELLNEARGDEPSISDEDYLLTVSSASAKRT